MLDLNTITQQVQREEQKKFDVAVRLEETIPTISESGMRLNMGGRKAFGMTHNGQSSLLSKVGIPGGFFGRSSTDLQRMMLEEHFNKNAKGQNVILRAKKGEDNDIVRFVASSKYAKFDDVSVVESLQKVPNLDDFVIREFHQTDEHFVLRITTKDPLEIRKDRPYWPGIQIINSEIGKSSVNISFLLWEMICTNGMTIVKDEFASFRRKHFGRKNQESLAESASAFLGKVEHFKEASFNYLSKASMVKFEDAIELIEKDKRIPKKVKESLEQEYLPSYAPSNDQATGMDVISAYTEAIQNYNWDSRLAYEDIAGELLLEMQ